MATITTRIYPSSINYDLMASYITVEDPAHPITSVIGKGPENTTYAQWDIPPNSGDAARVVYNFDFSSIPLNATITKVDGYVTSMISNIASNVVKSRGGYFRYIFNGNYTICGNYTVSNVVEAHKITVATLKRNQLDGVILDLLTVRANKSTAAYQRFYGACLEITYTVPDVPTTDALYVKESNIWEQVTEVYKKIDGVWVLQNDVTNAFSENVIPVRIDDTVYFTDNIGNRFVDKDNNYFIGG